MRKFIATIALIITLIGTFAPVAFSVNGLQKNIVSADVVDVTFGKDITITEIPTKTDHYRLETTVLYDNSTDPDTPFNGFNYFGNFPGALDPNYTVINSVTGETLLDEQVTEPEKLGLKDSKYGLMRQDIKITTPGKYEAWFYEDYVVADSLPSSKIKFEITANKKVINAQISTPATNVRGDNDVRFTQITGDVVEGSDKAKFSVGVTYTNPDKQTTEDAPENLYWVLKDKTGEIKAENPIELNPNPKYNTKSDFTIEIPNLTVGESYEVQFVEKDITTTGGKIKGSQSFPFTAGTPIDNAAVQQQLQQQNADNALADLKNSFGKDGTDSKDGLDCSLWEMDFFCYLVKFTVYITTFVPNIIATVSGLLSDFFLKFAMDPKMYGLNYTEGLGSMIYGAWSIVRDFANIGFIFALFTAAFMLILNKTEINNVQFEPKKVVVRVVIMALLVNFSLMFCRLIIQSADVFSHILYNKIVVTVQGDKAISAFLTEVGVKSVSFGLVTNTNPQQLFINQGVSKDDPGSYTAYLAIGFITFFIYLIYIYLFVSMTLIWMGRIFGAWIAMILSPIAFVSWAIPFIEDDKHIGFTNWLQNFVKLAFLVPIYLFFVYIAINVLNLQNLTSGINDPDAGWMFSVIVIIIKILLPLFAATFILMKGKTIAYDMSGEIGKVAGKFTGMATSLALGAATGGSALLARQTLGRAGSALANANRGNNSFLGKGMRTVGDKLGAASFDVRKNEQAMKRFGQFTSAAGDKIDLGTKGLREGGFVAEGTLGEQYRKQQERIAKEKEEEIKKAADKALADAQAKDAQELRENQAKLETAKKAKEAEEAKIAMEAENQGPESFINKKEAEKENLQNQNIQLSVEKLTVESEKATLVSDQADIQNELTALEDEKAIIEKDIQVLEAAATTETDPDKKANIEAQVNFQKADLATKNTEIQNKKIELQNKTIEIDNRDKTIAEKEKEIQKNEEEIKKADAYQKNLAGITSVRDARQKKKDLELEAEHSDSKAKADKMKTEMDAKKTKADEAQKELNTLKTKLKNEKPDSPRRAQIEADIAEKEKDRDKKDDEYKKAKEDHKKALDTFNDEFGNKIKAMEDFEKEAISAYSKTDDVIKRRKKTTDNILNAQKAVNQSQNNLDNLNYAFQQQYANDVEKAAQFNEKVAGSFAQHIGTITGGRIMGGSVGRSADFAAGGVRRNASSRY